MGRRQPEQAPLHYSQWLPQSGYNTHILPPPHRALLMENNKYDASAHLQK